MTKEIAEKMLAEIEDKIEQQGRVVDARLLNKRNDLIKLIASYEQDT